VEFFKRTGWAFLVKLTSRGFGFNYFPYQHIGATAWYVMGALAKNPLQLLK
jgi:hypothetical protein